MSCRLFHVDLLGDLVDRMAAYGGKGRLITASSAGYQDECKVTHELEKSDSRRWFLQVPGVRTGKHRRLAKRQLQDAPVSVLCHAVLRIGAGGNSVPPRRPGRTMEGDKETRWYRAPVAFIWTPSLRRSNPCGPSCGNGSGRTHTASKPAAWPKSSHFRPGAWPSRTNPRPRKGSPPRRFDLHAVRTTTRTLSLSWRRRHHRRRGRAGQSP